MNYVVAAYLFTIVTIGLYVLSVVLRGRSAERARRPRSGPPPRRPR